METMEKGAVSVTAELETVSVVETTDLETYIRRTNELKRAAEKSGHGMSKTEPLTSPTHFVLDDRNNHL